jgi:DNA-directed RNA polymerase specialized sigma24 family protein
LARAKLGDRPRRVADEEDLALSAFHSLCQGAEHGRFPQLMDRDNLWKLLATITANKALNLIRDADRLKRGSGAVRGESAFIGSNGARDAGIEAIVGADPTPEFAAQMAEEYDRLLLSLDDSELASIARWKMEGYSTDEIAEKLGKSLSTIERKLRVIRSIWEEAGVAA